MQKLLKIEIITFWVIFKHCDRLKKPFMKHLSDFQTLSNQWFWFDKFCGFASKQMTGQRVDKVNERRLWIY